MVSEGLFMNGCDGAKGVAVTPWLSTKERMAAGASQRRGRAGVGRWGGGEMEG